MSAAWRKAAREAWVDSMRPAALSMDTWPAKLDPTELACLQYPSQDGTRPSKAVERARAWLQRSLVKLIADGEIEAELEEWDVPLPWDSKYNITGDAATRKRRRVFTPGTVVALFGAGGCLHDEAPSQYLAAWFAAMQVSPVMGENAPPLALVASAARPEIVTKAALLARLEDQYPNLPSALRNGKHQWVKDAKRGRNRYELAVIEDGCRATWAADSPAPYGAMNGAARFNRCK